MGQLAYYWGLRLRAVNSVLDIDGGSYGASWVWNNTNFATSGQNRGAVFYDYNDTYYFVDPNGSSRTNEFLALKMRGDTNGNYNDNNGWWTHDPYGYGWGKPHGSFRSLEVSTSGNFSTEPAMFRIHQWGSGAAEFWKPQGTTLFLRETPGGGGSWFTRFYVQRYVETNESMRAPIFYDSDNTGYYVNAAGDSVLGGIYTNGGTHYINTWNNGTIYIRSSQGDGGIYGRGNSGQFQYQLYGDGGGNWGFLNGVWASWDLRKNNGGGLYLNNQSTYYMDGYTSYMGRVYGTADMRSPIYYDLDNTGYYVDPNGTSRIGGIQIGGADAGSTGNQIRFYGLSGDAAGSYNHAAIIERLWRNSDESELLIFKGNDPDTGGIHDRVRIAATGRVVFHSWNTYGDVDGYISSVGTGNIDGSGYFYGSEFHVPGDIRTPIMYDRNNTGYYNDPDGTSRYNYVVPNRIKLVNNVNYEPRWDFTAYVVEAQHWYGNNGSMTMYMGESGNTIQVPGSGGIRPQIMYDYSDTTYYTDPNSESNMVVTRTALRAKQGMAGYGGGSWFDDFSNTPVTSMTFGQDKYTGGPSGTWWFQLNMRHNNGSNNWGTQLAYGWEDNANRFFSRNVQGGSWSGWVEYANTNNFGSLGLLTTGNYTGTLDGRYFFDYGFTTGYPGTNADGMPGNRSAFTYSNAAPLTGCIAHFGASGYGIQLNGDYYGDSFSLRSRNGDNGTWRPWKRMLTDYNYSSYAVIINGWHGNLYHNTDGRIYSTIVYDTNDSGYYSDPNGGCRFAYTNTNGGFSQSNTQFQFNVNRGGYCGSLDSGNMQPYSQSNNSAFFSFHKAGYYAVNMGLDADNVIRIGGWSASSNRWQLDPSGNMYAAGNVVAYSSDERLKENITTIPNALDMLKELRGVYFDWKDFVDDLGFNPIDRHDIGVIAQEVEKVIPQAIKPAPFDALGDGKSISGEHYKTVQLEKIIPVLIQSVKEQQEIIENQNKQIEELKEMVYQILNKK